MQYWKERERKSNKYIIFYKNSCICTPTAFTILESTISSKFCVRHLRCMTYGRQLMSSSPKSSKKRRQYESSGTPIWILWHRNESCRAGPTQCCGIFCARKEPRFRGNNLWKNVLSQPFDLLFHFHFFLPFERTKNLHSFTSLAYHYLPYIWQEEKTIDCGRTGGKRLNFSITFSNFKRIHLDFHISISISAWSRWPFWSGFLSNPISPQYQYFVTPTWSKIYWCLTCEKMVVLSSGLDGSRRGFQVEFLPREMRRGFYWVEGCPMPSHFFWKNTLFVIGK